MAYGSSNSPMPRLVERLSRLPGIGKRSAQRLAFHLLRAPAQEVEELSAALLELKRNTRQCSRCFNLTDCDPCPICADARRDQELVMVVEQPGDVASLEALEMFKGVYHVLMGRLEPLEGLGPSELNIQSLLERVRAQGTREVILATNPTFEGDGTALFLAQELAKLGVKVTRLARGLPTGYSLEMASKAVLADAIQGRQAMEG